jgi:APA family basic amino acid/polyamine antiporter
MRRAMDNGKILTKAMQPHKQIGFATATSVIVTNMIGAGVFTSLGFQLMAIQSPFAIFLLWLLGGVIALCGAAVYAELGVRFPRSGGEYNFLSNTIHPMAGFLAGWLSATVGFAAPVALSAKGFGFYLSRVLPQIDPSFAACICVLALCLIHSVSVREGTIFQNAITACEVILIIFLIIMGLSISSHQPISFMPDRRSFQDIFSSSFAVSLVYVFYSYCGWNASTYIASEIRNPQKNLPASLLIATFMVTILYILLNLTFLYTTPISELQGVLEIAHVSSIKIFGSSGAKIMSIIVSIVFIGSISGMTLAGPRVLNVMSEDYPLFKPFLKRNSYGSPYIAIVFQSCVALFLVISSTFEAIITYISFTLSLSTCLTVIGIFIVRSKRADSEILYKCWGYPVTPILFLGLNLWMLIYIFYEKPMESIFGLTTLSTGVPVYLWAKRM